MQPVSLTAQWTAAIRSIESERDGDSMFNDPLAGLLAQPDGFELLKRYNGAGVQSFVAIRTKFIDDAIARILNQERHPSQVVFVAAGMDTRAYRLSWPAGVTLYEVDHGALLDEKQRRLSEHPGGARAQRIPVPADLAGNWADALTAAGFSRALPTLWVIEGLLFFLTEGQVRSLLVTCHGLSHPESRMVTDMTSESLLKSPFTQQFLSMLRRDGTPWQFGTDEPEIFLEGLGWVADNIQEPGTPGAGEGRWPYPHQPRQTKGVARNWLITASVR